jgi:hypothetical protein
MATIHVEVDIDDILWDMSTSEKEDLCKELIEDGYAPAGSLPNEGRHPDEDMYIEAVYKLKDAYGRLSAEQHTTIMQIANLI